MGAVLQDMAESLESAECYLILHALVSAISLCFTISFGVLATVVQHPHWSWRYLCGCSFLAFVVSMVLLVEPRPLHWMPSLEAIWTTLRRCSLSECKVRMRRWWRWRSKYAAKSKLNV